MLQPTGLKQISPQELKTYLEQGNSDPLLLDVREAWEYDRCHIENSQLIPMAQIPIKMNELDSDRETVVICHHGVRSWRVASFLLSNGFSQVYNLSGGVDAWAKTVDPQMPTY